MSIEEHQLELFDETAENLTRARDLSRDRWTAARRRHAIGSHEEHAAWEAYEGASQRLLDYLREQRSGGR